MDAAVVLDGHRLPRVSRPTGAGHDRDVDGDRSRKGTTYAFAVRSRDAAGNWSAISNVVTGTPSGHAHRSSASRGDDRYLTAIAVSRGTFATGTVGTVVLATGKDYPDALSASALADRTTARCC